MLTIDELARVTMRSPELIRRWVRAGEIPAHRVGTRILLAPEAISMVNARPRANRRRPALVA